MNFPVILGCDVDANVELIMTVGRESAAWFQCYRRPGTVRCLNNHLDIWIDVPAIDESLAVGAGKDTFHNRRGACSLGHNSSPLFGSGLRRLERLVLELTWLLEVECINCDISHRDFLLAPEVP